MLKLSLTHKHTRVSISTTYLPALEDENIDFKKGAETQTDSTTPTSTEPQTSITIKVLTAALNGCQTHTLHVP